jgi:dihydroneopterin aldolase/2-amino-4-hydroxy-6-hydroxymethyldihydropteridine diphosphokinase
MAPKPRVEAYVAVGSNIDPENNIRAALAKLRRQVRVTAVSTFYRTPFLPPKGQRAAAPPEQPPYVNGVWRIETDKDPRALKTQVLQRIEEDLGRRRGADKYAPRTIDLDLAVYGDRVLNEPGLQVPHPEIRERPFVAVPLLEIAPDLVLADTGEPLASLPVTRRTEDMQTLGEFTVDLRETAG